MKNEPRHEQNNRKQRRRTSKLISSVVCFRNTDSTIPLLSKSIIDSLNPSSVLVQFGLYRTCSKPHCWFSHEAAQTLGIDVRHDAHLGDVSITSVLVDDGRWNVGKYYKLTWRAYWCHLKDDGTDE